MRVILNSFMKVTLIHDDNEVVPNFLATMTKRERDIFDDYFCLARANMY